MAEQRDYGDEQGEDITGKREPLPWPPYDPATTTTYDTRFRRAEEALVKESTFIVTALVERNGLRDQLLDAQRSREMREMALTLEPQVAIGKNERERGAILSLLCEQDRDWTLAEKCIVRSTSDIALVDAAIEGARDRRSIAKRVMDYETATRMLEAYSRK